MRFLKSVWAVVTARWFVTLIGALLLAALVWWFGPLLAFGEARPLESDLARLVTILVITFVWGASNLWAQYRVRRANAQMVGAIAKAAPEPGPADAELKELQAKFEQALGRLKTRRFETSRGKSFLYQLPWYLLIGPPGSGKTTALLQSGLRFPLAEGDRDRELQGVGGTRNCDWFFTDEAVLIDTAGRYTTQDSYQAADQAAWTGFLDLLKKNRPRQPVNGVIVALSLTDIVRGEAGLLDAHARAVRLRLDELQARLGVALPVYLMLTKADLVQGFAETFADLSEREREQVLGLTLPYDREAPKPPPLSAFEAEWDRLLARLDERVPLRLQAERDLERRASIFAFPRELAAVKAPLARFLDRLVQASGYDRPVLLRGVYLSSGTQEGTPIDRLMQAMAASFGVRAQAPVATRGNRSFFLTRLLKDVVFAEAGLVGANPRLERLDLWRRRLALAGAVALVLAMGAAWAYSYSANHARTVELARQLAGYAEAAQPVAGPELPVASAGLAEVLPALERLRTLPAGAAEANGSEPWSYRLGLSQRSSVGSAAEQAYRRGLERLYLPRLIARLERQLWAKVGDPDFVLEGLKVYLMLGGLAPLDEELIAAWIVALDIQPTFAADPASRQQAELHLAALLVSLPSITTRPALDAELIARARDTIRRLPLARRAYDALTVSPLTRGIPPWSPQDHAGPVAAQVLTRHSGQPLGAGIPGLYTYQGFHDAFLPLLPDFAAEVAVEGWLLGAADDAALAEADLSRLQRDMLRLYYDDYIQNWDRLLRDVTIRPLGDLRQSVDALNALAGPNSPLKLLLGAILFETRLTEVPEEPEAAAGGLAIPGAAVKLGTRLLGRVGAQAKRLAKLAGPGGGAAAGAGAVEEVPGQPVEDHFAFLAALVEGVAGAPPALDEGLAALGRLYGELQQIAISPNPDQALLQRGGLAAVAAPVAQAAARMPAPLDGMLQGIAERATSLSEGAIRRQLNAIWQTEVLPFCRQAIAGRFPFERGSGIDASLPDFGRLFAPGGLIDGYTNQHLVPLVNTTTRPWRFNVAVGIPDAALAPFEIARRIRDSLFAGGATPGASFTLKPVELDAQASRVVVDLDGQSATYQHGPVQPAAMRWPGPSGTNLVRVTFVPLGGGTPVIVSKEGAWSWFRLLHEASFQPTNLPELFRVGISAGPHRAGFELQAASVANPFNLGLLGQFRCPERL